MSFNKPPRSFDKPSRPFDKSPRSFDRSYRPSERAPGRSFDKPPRSFDRPDRFSKDDTEHGKTFERSFDRGDRSGRPDRPHRSERSERPDRSEPKAPFRIDAQAIKALSSILHESQLTEIQYSCGPISIRLVRSGSYVAGHTVPPVTVCASDPKVFDTASGVHKKEEGFVVTAPLVGTIYLSSKPGEEPFVKVGDFVEEGQVLLIIEAMKVMNPLKAPVKGYVRKIFVADGMPVEYKEDLLLIE